MATNQPAIWYFRTVTLVWKENTWCLVPDVARSLPKISSRNGRAGYFLALDGEKRL